MAMRQFQAMVRSHIRVGVDTERTGIDVNLPPATLEELPPVCTRTSIPLLRSEASLSSVSVCGQGSSGVGLNVGRLHAAALLGDSDVVEASLVVYRKGVAALEKGADWITLFLNCTTSSG